MVKPPKIRHSKTRTEPMTIDLGPDDVSRIDVTKSDEAKAAEAAADASAEQTEASPVETGETGAGEAGPVNAVAGGTPPADDQPAVAETAASAEPEREAADVADPTSPSAKVGEEERFIGSEWPPEPAAASEQETRKEEEAIHAFGRDPGAPPPGAASRAARDAQDAPIRVATAPEPRRSGMAGALAGGVLGAVIALAAAAGLQLAGILPSTDGSEVPAGETEAIAAVRTELAALKEELDEVRAGGNIDTSGLTKTITDLSSGVQGLTTALDQVKADVASLKSAVSQGAAGDGAAVEALNTKIAEIEASVAALGQGGANISQEAIDAINQKLGAVEQAAASAAESARTSEGRIAAIEQSVTSLGDQVASLADQVSKQEAQPKVALAIAGAALKSAIERGGPFTAEVETFAAIAPDAPELPQLREIAQKGVASHADLVAGMDDAANAMIAASETVSEDAGFWEDLLDSAESLVEVRPIGEVEGETVPAKVARMEVAVKAGELTRALAEFDTLPETSKAAGLAFAELIRTRVTAQDLVAKALAGALKAA